MPEQIDFAERLEGFGSARYVGLRSAQAHVLAGYVRYINNSDLAVELPTGYGKTLVGLLIADLALERGQTVAYLTGTNQLADQVLLQADGLPGLDAVKFSSQNYPQRT
jgi:superfamily II DNA or RNA helicase